MFYTLIFIHLKNSNPEHSAADFLWRPIRNAESPGLVLPLGLVYHSSHLISAQHSSDGSGQDGTEWTLSSASLPVMWVVAVRQLFL